MKLSPWQRGNSQPIITGWYQCKGIGFLEGPIVWRYYDIREERWFWNSKNIREERWFWNSKNRNAVGDNLIPPKMSNIQMAGFRRSDKWRGVID